MTGSDTARTGGGPPRRAWMRVERLIGPLSAREKAPAAAADGRLWRKIETHHTLVQFEKPAERVH